VGGMEKAYIYYKSCWMDVLETVCHAILTAIPVARSSVVWLGNLVTLLLHSVPQGSTISERGLAQYPRS
jgi:hypothetical protein